MSAAYTRLTTLNFLRCTFLRPTPFVRVRHVSSPTIAMARKKNKALKNVASHPSAEQSLQTSGSVKEPVIPHVDTENPFVGQALLDALERDSKLHDEESNPGENRSLAAPAEVPQNIGVKMKKKKNKKHNARTQQISEDTEPLTGPPAGWQQLATQMLQLQPGDTNWEAHHPILQSVEQQTPAAFSYQSNLPRYHPTTYPSISSGKNNGLPAKPVAIFDPQPPTNHLPDEQYSGLGQGLWPLQPNFAPVNSSLPVRSAAQLNWPYTPYTPVFNHASQAFPSNLNAAAPSFAPVQRYHTSSQVDSSRDPRIIARQSKAPSPSDPAESPSPPKSPRSPKSPRIRPTVYSVRPSPDPSYIIQACVPPSRLANPQPLLLISDLNGTLIIRSAGHNAAGLRANFKCRPGLTDFLDYIYSSHTVMIWTSAMPRNCAHICEKLLPQERRQKTIAIWARDKLGLTPEQFKGDPNVYKRLEFVWTDASIQQTHPDFSQGGRWSQKNTVLIDDSILKASAQPFNLLNIPELTSEAMKSELREAVVKSMPTKAGVAKAQHTVLCQVAGYLEEAKWWTDVSSFMRSTPFKTGDGWGGKGKGAVPHVQGEPELNVYGVDGAL